MVQDAPNLQQLYDRTLSLFGAEGVITRALDWTDQVVPVFARACRNSLESSASEPLDLWVDWINSDKFNVIEEAGKGPIFEWRRSWLKILLLTTSALRKAGDSLSAEACFQQAQSVWTGSPELLTCFSQAFWQDLVAYLGAPLLASTPSLSRESNITERYSFPFPLVLSHPFLEGNTEVKIILARFVYEMTNQQNGEIFLHPEQAALRCMDAQFALSFDQAAHAVREQLRDRFRSLPDVRVRIRTIKPAHERLLTGMVLGGPSAAGALALGLYCFFTGNTSIDSRTAVSFSFPSSSSSSSSSSSNKSWDRPEDRPEDGSPDWLCLSVAGVDDKIAGCVQQGMRRLLLETIQHRSVAAYGRAQGLETIGATTFSEAIALAASRKIVLLYHRHAAQDQQLAARLQSALTARGHRIFVDRDLPVGIEWAKKIVDWIQEADAVVPLLSAQSLMSDMLAYELQTAYEARQRPGAKPRLLPIRVAYEGALPERIAYILDPLQYALWTGADDDARLLEALERALEQEEDMGPVQEPISPLPGPYPHSDALEPFDGPVPLESRFYIPRNTDREFFTAVDQRHSVILVKGPRQTGKSSLLARGLDQAMRSGSRIVMTDFQKLSRNDLSSLVSFYRALARMLARQLKIDASLDALWIEGRSENINFEEYFEDYVLAENGNLFWGIDEADRLFTIDFCSDVFGLFRSWANERQARPHSPWQRLTLAIAYATEAHLFIQDQNQSPFNIGTRLELEDFTLPQVAKLNALYGSPLRGDPEIQRFYDLVGGHPYLVRRGLYALARTQMSRQDFETQASSDSGPMSDHLRRILTLLAQNEVNRQAVQEILLGKPCPTYETFYHLRSAGIIAGDSTREARPRCRLYADYLSRHLFS